LVFLFAGAVVGACVAVLPPRGLKTIATVLAVLAALGLGAVPWFGNLHDGARRWLSVGPLQVYVSILAFPVFVGTVVHASRAWRPWVAPLLVAAVCGLLLAQPDPAGTIVYALGAVAIPRIRWARWAVAVVAALAITAAWVVRSEGTPLPHVEHAPQQLAAHFPLWFGVAMACILVVAAWSVHCWIRLARSNAPGHQEVEPAVAGSTCGLLSLMIVPLAVGDGGLPWVSFGGSAVVASFALTGLVLRGERIARPLAAT